MMRGPAGTPLIEKLPPGVVTALSEVPTIDTTTPPRPSPVDVTATPETVPVCELATRGVRNAQLALSTRISVGRYLAHAPACSLVVSLTSTSELASARAGAPDSQRPPSPPGTAGDSR